MTIPRQNVKDYDQKRLENISMMLKEMRLADGRNQDGYINDGLTRRQIQRGESGCNLTLKKLFLLLDCFGYTLKDIDWTD